MEINESKTKYMIYFQFTTRLSINEKPIDVISSTRLLGTIIQDNLKWDNNTKELVRKANARMELLRRVANFNPPIDDLKTIYVMYVRSILEFSATVWHSSITEENRNDLERVQKTAFKIILGDRYKTYQNALNILNLETLDERRNILCLNFAKRTSKHPKLKKMFPLNEKMHSMKTRKQEKYKVQKAQTERLKRSAVIFMQNLLNEQEK